MKRLNIAYGSNLCIEQMAQRCPTAKIYGKGLLKGYRLAFQGRPNNAYATIVKSDGDEVPVIVWELKPRDEKALDMYEGYPNSYYKENLQVELESGEAVTAMVYIMTNRIPGRTSKNNPSSIYLGTILRGYIAAGFDYKYLQTALDEI